MLYSSINAQGSYRCGGKQRVSSTHQKAKIKCSGVQSCIKAGLTLPACTYRRSVRQAAACYMSVNQQHTAPRKTPHLT